VFIFFRLLGEHPKSGLSLAIAMGFAVFAPTIAVLYYAREWEASWWTQGCLLLLVLIQPVLVAAAVRAYKSFPAGPRDRLKLAMSSSYGVLIFLGFWSFGHFGNFPSPVESNEHSAMESMRSVYMDASVYSRDHVGFPENLAAWGHPGVDEKCKAYGLPVHEDSGYLFDYRGEPFDKPMQGCMVAKTYAATARPVVFGKTGRRSFFVDQTGVIRSTSENRPATASDAPIPPGSLPPLP